MGKYIHRKPAICSNAIANASLMLSCPLAMIQPGYSRHLDCMCAATTFAVASSPHVAQALIIRMTNSAV